MNTKKFSSKLLPLLRKRDNGTMDIVASIKNRASCFYATDENGNEVLDENGERKFASIVQLAQVKDGYVTISSEWLDSLLDDNDEALLELHEHFGGLASTLDWGTKMFQPIPRVYRDKEGNSVVSQVAKMLKNQVAMVVQTQTDSYVETELHDAKQVLTEAANLAETDEAASALQKILQISRAKEATPEGSGNPRTLTAIQRQKLEDLKNLESPTDEQVAEMERLEAIAQA